MTLHAREDMFLVTVNIGGRDFGVWEGRAGGAGDSEETKAQLGGMGGQVSLGGPQTIENVKIKKLFDLDTIGQEIAWLYANRGKARATVNNQPLDRDGNQYGRRWSYTGTYKMITPPDYDAESADKAYIELEISTDGVVA